MKSLQILLLVALATTPIITAHAVPTQIDLAQVPRPMTPEEVKVWGPKFQEETKAKSAAKKAAETANSQLSTKSTENTKNETPENNAITQSGNNAISAFFTGKPYIHETSAYALTRSASPRLAHSGLHSLRSCSLPRSLRSPMVRYRSYDPELNRWTSQDPSGFPDGANNLAYLAIPTWQFDWQGLVAVELNIQIFASQKKFSWLWGTQFTDVNISQNGTVSAKNTSSVATAVYSNQTVEWMSQNTGPFLQIQLYNTGGTLVDEKQGNVWGLSRLEPGGHALLVYGDRVDLPSDKISMIGGYVTVLVRYQDTDWTWKAYFE